MPPNDPKDGKRGQGFSPDHASAKRPSGKSWFFGVGINQYAHFSPLNNAVKDVKDLLIVLQDQYGFDPRQTITLFDEAATRDNIIDELDALIKKVNPEDKLLLYYSGHGHLNRAVNLAYWIPQDARKDRTSGYIPNSTVRDYIKAIPALHTLLISDSCFSGTLFVRGASRSDEAADELEQRRSRWGIVSGRHDEEVYDGEPGTNSPFAASILKVLGRNREAKLNVARLADRVVEMTRANYQQLPEGNPLFGVGHDGGQYLFRLAASESNLWERCLAEHSLPAFNDYLDQFPNGIHADEALQHIRELEEKSAWQQAERIGKIYGYRTFIRSFPAGKFGTEARQRIRQLQSAERENEERNDWETVKGQDTKGGYSSFLKKYPTGQFASQAQDRIKELEELEQQAEWEGKIEKAWQQTQDLDTIGAYEAFIQQYPEHRYSKTARSRLEVKRKEERREKPPGEKVSKQQDLLSETSLPESHPKSPLQRYLPYALGGLLLIILAIWLPNWNKHDPSLSTSTGNLSPFEAEDNRYGYKNDAGNIVIPAHFDLAYPFSENRAVVKLDDLHGIINQKGELLSSVKYEQIEAFVNGMAIVEVFGKYGYIDTTGYEIIPAQFESAGNFNEQGEANVTLNGREIYISKTGKCVHNCLSEPTPGEERPEIDWDEDTWEEIRDTNDPNNFQKYLDDFPNGKYRNEARQKIDEINKKRQRQQAAREEDQAWSTAKSKHTIAGYSDYLKRYPTGKYAPEAQSRESDLQEAARKKAAASTPFPRKGKITLGGKSYPTIQFKANGLTWMAQNLDYPIDNSWCFEDNEANCKKYGRLYTWEAAKKACQAVGWRLPSDQEWRNMAKGFGGASVDASDSGNAASIALSAGGSSGFSAELGGSRSSDGFYIYTGTFGSYWSATKKDGSDFAWKYTFVGRVFLHRHSRNKTEGYSCRCVQD